MSVSASAAALSAVDALFSRAPPPPTAPGAPRTLRVLTGPLSVAVTNAASAQLLPVGAQAGAPPSMKRKRETSEAATPAATAATRLVAAAAAAASSTAVTDALARSGAALERGLARRDGCAAPVFVAARKRRTAAADRPDAGAKWFDMPAAELTAELKRDMLLLRHRAYLDPKRHYKGGGVDGGRLMELPRFFQVGTVVEAAHERLSRDARLTRRERKGTLVEALLADERLRQYAKRNYDAVAAEAARGGRKSKSLGGGGAAVSRKGRKSGGGKKR